MNYILTGFSDEYTPDFIGQLEGMNKLGVKFIELRFVDGENFSDLSDERMDFVANSLEKYGIKVSAMGSPLGKIDVDDDFAPHLNKAEKVYKFAKRLNCKYVRAFSFYFKNKTREEVREKAFERIEKLLSLAEKYDLVLCHENEADIYGESPEQCLEILQRFGGRLRAVFDMGNFILKGYEPYPHAYELLKDYIEYFHIKDATTDRVIVPCGEGDGHVKDLLLSYKKDFNRENVFVSMEPHLFAFTGLDKLGDVELKRAYSFPTSADGYTYNINNMKKILEEVER